MPSRNSWGAAARSTVTVAVSAAIAIGAPACSGGGGGGVDAGRGGCADAGTGTGVRSGADAGAGADAGTGAPAMAVEVWYPPGSGLMTSDSLTVRGGSSNPSTIVAVRVNGVLATTTNGFAEWEAEIPLAPGTTTVIVEGEDADGQVATVATVTITRPETFDLWGSVGAAALDPCTSRALVVEETGHYPNVWPSGKTLSFVDLETGARDLLPDDGARGAMDGALAVAPDLANNRLLVTTMRHSSGSRIGVYEIDLGTGARTLISDDQRGSGTPLAWPFLLAIDHAHDRAVVLDIGDLYGGWDSIVAVDLDTGDRTVLSGDGVGAGVMPREPVDLVLDPAGDIAYVLDSGLEALLSVDLATGARTVLASGLKVSGQLVFGDPEILMMRSTMELDVTNRRALILGPSGELQAIDLATGDHTLVAANISPFQDFGTGTFMFDSERDRVIFSMDHAFMAFDLTTGEHQRISNTGVGDGPYMGRANGVALNKAGDRAYVSGSSWKGNGGVLEVDLKTGNRRAVAGLGVDMGQPFAATDVVLDEGMCRLFVADSERGRVVEVALETGRADIFWDASAAFPDAGGVAPRAMALYRDKLLVLTHLGEPFQEGEEVLSTVDLDSGAWETLSGMGTGTGPTLEPIDNMAISHEDDLAFVGKTTSHCSIVAIDLASGDRHLVFESDEPYSCRTEVFAYDPVRGRLVMELPTSEPDDLHFFELATGDITPIPVDHSLPGSGISDALTLDRHGYSLIAADSYLHALVALDPGSGQMIVLSR